jgi:hypothetical protein
LCVVIVGGVGLGGGLAYRRIHERRIQEYREGWRDLITLRTGGTTLVHSGIPVWAIPDQCHLRAQIFGRKGNILFEEDFPGGWRIDVISGQVSPCTEAGCGLVELHCERFINGVPVARQYYRMLKNKLVLVRLEDNRGACIENNFVYPNHTIGPPIPVRDPADWEASLSSSDPAELLWALVWIGGQHATASELNSGLLHEGAKAAAHWQEVRIRKGVLRRLSELSAAPNVWVAEAAKTALAWDRK